MTEPFKPRCFQFTWKMHFLLRLSEMSPALLEIINDNQATAVKRHRHIEGRLTGNTYTGYECVYSS